MFVKYQEIIIMVSSNISLIGTGFPDFYDGKVQQGLGWYTINISGEKFGGHRGGYVGAPALMKLRYSDNVGIILLWNQNLYLFQSLNISRPEEDTARKQIEKALFEKADELCNVVEMK